jgi:hypothetical protein
MDDERLKNPNNIFGKDYFEEQLEFDKYRVIRDKLFESDFDKQIKRIERKE